MDNILIIDEFDFEDIEGGSMFYDDPSSNFIESVKFSGEKKLMAAVLLLAVRDWENRGRDWSLGEQAKEWLLGREDDYLFSAKRCYEELGICREEFLGKLFKPRGRRKVFLSIKEVRFR